MTFADVASTLFAAVAAIASVVTVALTIENRHDERLRRLAEALVTYRSAAELAPLTPGRDEAFGRARDELQRAVVLPLELPLEVHDCLGWMLDPDARLVLADRAKDADRSLKLLTNSPPPLMPRWYRRLVSFAPRRRARRG